MFSSIFKHKLLLIVLTLSVSISGCGGGGNTPDSSVVTLPVWTDDAVTLSTNIDLPVNSPIVESKIEVTVFDKAFTADTLGDFQIKASKKTLTDAYIMLPPVTAGGDPTVYLFTTIFPGEDSVELSVENTAISLIMNSLPRFYLDNSGTAQQIKEIILLYAEPFIQKFTTMIESDPYVLRINNLVNVYDVVYQESVAASYEALKLLLQTSLTASRAAINSANKDELGGQFIVTPEAEQDSFKILAEFKEGKLTGNVLIQNDTRLFAHYEVITTLNDVIKEIPLGFVNSAYHPDILVSQSGFWGGFTSSEQLVDTGFKNVNINIETAGLLNISPDYINTSGPGILARTTFSNFLLPVINIVLPITDLGHDVFGVLADSGVFDDAVMQSWRSGEIADSLNVITGNFTPAIITKVIEKSFNYSLTKGRIAELLIKLTLRLTAVEIMGAITGIELREVESDLKNTRSVLKFSVLFPITLEYISHNVVDKESELPTKISLHGHGLQVFTYQDVEYSPTVILLALDKDGYEVRSERLKIPDIVVNAEGTVIDFYIPQVWLGQDDSLIKNIDVVDVKILHHYIKPDTFFNTLESVELPSSIEDQLNYRIDLTSGLLISTLSESKVQGNDLVEITGSGFAAEAALNKVYLVIDRSGYKNLMTVDYVNVDRTLLKVITPDHEDLVLAGPAKIHVEIEDGTESNKLPVVVIPENVSAEPGSISFESLLNITLSAPQAFTYILYSTDGWLTENVYSSVITIDINTSLFTKARTNIEGVDYDSEVTTFEYNKCSDNEMVINGECQKPCTLVCDNPIISNVITVPGYMLDTNENNPLVYNINLTFENTYKWCTNIKFDLDFYNGEKHMLYLYKNFRHADGSWNTTYINPLYGARDFMRGKASVDISYDRMITSLWPKLDGYTQVFNLNPEDIFAIAIVNYDNNVLNNGNDYMRISLGVKPVDTVNYYYTYLNPEIVESNGCYEGDF